MYKKFLAGALALTMAAGLVAFPVAGNGVVKVNAAAPGETVQVSENVDSGLQFTLISGNDVCVSKFTRTNAESVTIPYTLRDKNNSSTTYHVKRINANVFKGMKDLRSISIEEGITEIGASAFEGDTNLSFRSLPNSLQTIGASAFKGCFGGKNADGTQANKQLTITGNVNYIDNEAFESCGFETVELASTVDTMGSNVFANCEKLKTVTVGNRVTKLGNGTFSGCTNLETLSLQGNLNTIPDNFCKSCKELKSITIPASVTRIGERAFSDCTHLTSVSLNSGLETIDGGAFYNCERLESVIIPNSVKTIGTQAFGYVNGKPLAKDKFTIYGSAIIDGKQSIASQYAEGLFTFKEYVAPTPTPAPTPAPAATAPAAKKNIASLSLAKIKRLKKGSDYSVKASTGKITVTGKGNYTGKKTIKIKKATVSVKAAKKAVKVSAKKVSGASGYQFKVGSKSVKKSSTSTTVKGLKAKKKYSVKVRAYVTLGGTKYYGAWSSAKKVKTK